MLPCVLLLFCLWIAAFPAHADDDFVPLPPDDHWTTIGDYYERNAFSVYGPPLEEDMPRAREETRLYLDMVQSFYIISDDEDEFDYVAEAYSVPVGSFRPSSFRPGGENSIDVFDDDPLPENYNSSSYYVDTIRPSYLPGGPFKIRTQDGSEARARSLFADQPKKAPEPAAAAAKPDVPPPEETAADAAAAAIAGKPPATQQTQQAGRINAPKKPGTALPGSDQETLEALQKAVRDLGLEKQFDFGGKNQRTILEGDAEPHAPDAAASATPSAAPVTTQRKRPPSALKASKQVPAKKKPVPRKKKPAKSPSVTASPLPVAPAGPPTPVTPAPAPAESSFSVSPSSLNIKKSLSSP